LAILSGIIAYLIARDYKDTKIIFLFIGLIVGWCIAKLFLDIIQVATNSSLFYMVVDK
jgi:hypothetical protein